MEASLFARAACVILVFCLAHTGELVRRSSACSRHSCGSIIMLCVVVVCFMRDVIRRGLVVSAGKSLRGRCLLISVGAVCVCVCTCGCK